MKTFAFLLVLFTIQTNAQKAEDVLATSTGTTFTVRSLSAEGQKLYENRSQLIADRRIRLLSETISGILLELESKTRGRTAEQIVDDERAKIPAPTPDQIKAVYDANVAALGGRALDQVKGEIISFLRREPEQKALDTLLKALEAKYKVSYGIDVNSPALKPLDVVATVATRSITVRQFEAANQFALADIEAHIYEDLRADLESSIMSAIVVEEAKALKEEASDLLASEITDRMREFSDDERIELETALQKRLFAKYRVKILLKEPEPLVQNVSADDDPSLGKATAPITIVMFTDLQCPACARTHPVLKKVVGEYGERVRFVVRDFPLQNIHQDAFASALAANAARNQGKFFEYIEVLYRNQKTLDKASLVRFAEQLGLNTKQFELDFTSEKAAAEVRKDIADGKAYGAAGTPTVFVNGVKVHRLSAEGFRRAVERALLMAKP